MLTKKQVFDAALKYAQAKNPNLPKAAVGPDDAFISGAFWAADLLEAEVERLTAENMELRALYEETNDAYQKAILSLKQVNSEIAECRAKNNELRAALRGMFRAAEADHSAVYAENLFAEISKVKTIFYK